MRIVWENNANERLHQEALDAWNDMKRFLEAMYLTSELDTHELKQVLEEWGYLDVDAMSREEVLDAIDTLRDEYPLAVWKEGEVIYYQRAYGGPSYELRFYPSHVEFVYLDWGCGIAFDVSHYKAVQELGKELRSYYG